MFRLLIITKIYETLQEIGPKKIHQEFDNEVIISPWRTNRAQGVKKGQRMGIGISRKSCPPPRKFSDLRATNRSRLLYQIWVIGSIGLDHLSNSYARTEAPGIAYIHPCKI